MNYSGGSKGARETRALPLWHRFFHFYAVFRKNWPNNRLAPPLGLMLPPLGNPGSTTDYYIELEGLPKGGVGLGPVLLYPVPPDLILHEGPVV